MTTHTTAKENLKHQSEEHQQWTSELQLFRNELDIFEKRLGEVAVKNSNSDSRAQVEHFQNQFILQREQLDILLHDVRESQRELISQVQHNPTAWEHQSRPSEEALRARTFTYRNMFSGLKHEFHAFLSKVL